MWNGSKLPSIVFITLATDKTIPITVAIYCHILTIEKVGSTLNYLGIILILASGFI
jgi:hypothetical protein